MDDHEPTCAIELGYNWCTCIAYAEASVARGFAIYLSRSGQVPCGGHYLGSGPLGPGTRCVRTGCEAAV